MQQQIFLIWPNGTYLYKTAAVLMVGLCMSEDNVQYTWTATVGSVKTGGICSLYFFLWVLVDMHVAISHHSRWSEGCLPETRSRTRDTEPSGLPRTSPELPGTAGGQSGAFPVRGGGLGGREQDKHFEVTSDTASKRLPSFRHVAMAAGFLAVEIMSTRHSWSTEEKVKEGDGSCCWTSPEEYT